MTDCAGIQSVAAKDSDAELPAAFSDALLKRFGERTVAVVMYGSWLRGKRDTVLDFYVIVDRYRGALSAAAAVFNYLMPPNVYSVALEHAGKRHMAKYAVVSQAQFERSITRGFHSYFWARFAQPIEILFAQAQPTTDWINSLGTSAAERMLRATLPLMPAQFSTQALWQEAFRQTYAAELRSESAERIIALADDYAEHLHQHTVALAVGLKLEAQADQHWQQLGKAASNHTSWALRRALGKLLSLARLVKGAITFNDPLDYVLWKVERHSGVYETATARQRRYPLIFAWGLLWRIYRRGGFK